MTAIHDYLTDDEPTALPNLAGHLLNAIVPGLTTHGFGIEDASVDDTGLTVLHGRHRIRISWEELDRRPAPLDGYPHIASGRSA